MKYCVLVCLVLWVGASKAADFDTVPILNGKSTLVKGQGIGILEDKNNSLQFQQVRYMPFEVNKREIPNLDLSKSTFWVRFQVQNKTKNDTLLVRVPYPILDSVTFYYPIGAQKVDSSIAGGLTPLYRRRFRTQDFIFQLPVKPDSVATVFLKIRSNGPMLVPIFVGPPAVVFLNFARDDMIFGIYIGLIGVMLFYNLFIFFSVKDKNYLIYVFYIASVGITQACLKGYGYRYLWHNFPFITNQSVFWSGILSAIGSILFVKYFLQTRSKLPRINRILNAFIILDLIAGLLSIFSYYYLSYQIINTIALLGAVVLLLCGIILSVKGYRAARFYLIAWSFFLISVIIYVLETYSLVSFNLLTQNIILVGSGIEITLLSFALADKINTYKKDKELSQARALQASREKEQVVREQNIILESKVRERTFKLEQTNEELNQAMNNLKKAESQLVHAEKMASLGQLTAGIAHEINNPINFVKSNVRPLKMDIQDIMELVGKYQQVSRENIDEKLSEIDAFTKEIDLPTLHDEIASLLSGIEDGSTRTADIVKGLRTFSRVDEGELKEVDIHDGIDATMNLLNNIVPPNLQIVRQYGDLPPVECYPGRLNQVFMNILTNAIHAIISKTVMEADERITISTTYMDETVKVSIMDTGIGIPSDVEGKIFDPFFTTKDVGEGTGLGLSMVFSIIEKHHGRIEVNSEEGKGSEFIIIIPVKQPVKV